MCYVVYSRCYDVRLSHLNKDHLLTYSTAVAKISDHFFDSLCPVRAQTPGRLVGSGLKEQTCSVSWQDVVKATKPGSVCPLSAYVSFECLVLRYFVCVVSWLATSASD